MANKAAKITTIEGLAGMVQRGFLDLENRLGKRIDDFEKGVNSRFDNKLESRMTELESRMTELESRMSGLELRMKNIEEKVESIEEFNEDIVERLGRIEQLVDEDQQERLKRLENSMQRVFERLALK